MRNSRFKSEPKRLGIHISKHKNLAIAGIAGDAGDKAVFIEIWSEQKAFFQLSFSTWRAQQSALRLLLTSLRHQIPSKPAGVIGIALPLTAQKREKADLFGRVIPENAGELRRNG
jgi:hypothetical protein